MMWNGGVECRVTQELDGSGMDPYSAIEELKCWMDQTHVYKTFRDEAE